MKSKINFLSVLVGIALLCYHCKKDSLPEGHIDWTVTGRVLEYGSDVGIPNAEVKLLACETEFLGATTCLTKATAITDEDGRYTLSYVGEERYMYVDAEIPSGLGHFPFGDAVVLNQNDLGKDFDLEVFTMSNLRLTITNTRDSTIRAAFHVQSRDFPNTFEFNINSHKDTSLIFNMTANKDKLIFYHVKNNVGDIVESYQDTIVCPPRDTLYHNIAY